jgi:iron complex outermembrane recepter protein
MRKLSASLFFASTTLGFSNLAPVAAQGVASGEQTTDTTEIIVTAQRREEVQRDVPISITALNQEMLTNAGITNTLELSKVTPGVVLPLYGAWVLPSVRGISSSGAGLGESSNVAVYIDGVYQASQSAQLADLPDVESIQVLKGPQGTLYGQNAAGGAIIINTLSPSFTPTGRFNLSYGNFDDVRVTGFLSGPLNENIAASLSAAFRDRDGVNLDVLRGGQDDGIRSYLVRGKLLWKAGEGTSLTLQGFYSKRRDTGIYAGIALGGNSLGVGIARLPCAFGGLACLNLPIADKPHEFSQSPLPLTSIQQYGVSLSGEFEVGGLGVINTVTSYRKTNVLNIVDLDMTPVNTLDVYIDIAGRDFIQEVNFASTDLGRLSILAGLFFMDKRESYRPQVTRIFTQNAGMLFNTVFPALTPAFTLGAFSRSEKQSYAAYLEGSYDVTDELTITAAGRYSYEKQKVFNIGLPLSYRLGDPPLEPLPDVRGSFSFKKFTPRAVIRYKPSHDHTIYASYSKGFKSGYVNPGNVNVCTPSPQCLDRPVAPEVVDAFEIGYKGRIARRFEVSLAAFYYLYKDIQVFVYNPGPPPLSSYQNAAKGEIKGVEINGTLRATPELTINAGASYIDAKYKEFPSATVYIPTGFGNRQTAADVSGKRLMRAPEWTLNGSINYVRALNAGEIGVYVGGSYTSTIFFDPNNRARQPGYALLDAHVSFAPAAVTGARVVVWGRNLTNKPYLQSVLESQIADQASFGDPRTYGVRLEYSF